MVYIYLIYQLEQTYLISFVLNKWAEIHQIEGVYSLES